MANGIFGVDVHPGYQPQFDFAKAKRQGYKFAFVKASEGTSYVPHGFSNYFARGRKSGLQMGMYHFLDGNGGSGRAQADHFLEVVRHNGGPKGVMLCVDFENYGNRSPSNQQLEDFIRYVKKHTNDHKVIVYSTTSFWNGGDSTGPWGKHTAGAEVAWEARVWTTTEKRSWPKRFYSNSWLPWHNRQKPNGLGGKWPKLVQFTWGGRVGGLYVDTNCFRGTPEELKRLAT